MSRIVAAFLVFVGCSGPQEVVVPPEPTGPSPVESLAYEGRWLPAGGWFPENHRALERWLDSVSRRDFEEPPVAVFDWDNTCVFNDVGETVLRHQLDGLLLRMPPDALGEFISDRLNDQVTLAGGIGLADVRADVIDAYGELWPLIQAGDLEAARALPAHRDFRAKAAWLYEAFADTEGIGVEYTLHWLVGWLAGFSRDEVSELVEQAIDAARREPPHRTTWTAATEGRTGRLEHTFTMGLCPHEEIRDLMRALVSAGVRVYVVSASGELIVEAAASVLGYPVGPEAIYGIRVVLEGDVLTTRAPPIESYPIAYRQGKVDVIRREIGPEPIFVAGDADTDFEMLTAFAATEMRLVINRNRHDADIGQLYREALAPSTGRPITLLQGRDEGRCAFRPSQETSALGAPSAQ